MTHIPPDTLRAYLDNDAVLDAAARAHVEATVAADPATAAALEAMRAEREATDCLFARFAAPHPDAAATERAYRRFCARRDAAPSRPHPFGAWWGGATAALTAPRAARTRGVAFGGAAAAFALVLLVVFVPVGSLVSATLDQFRYQPEKFAVIALRSGDVPLLMGEGGGRGSIAGGGASGTTGANATNTGAFGDFSQYVAVTSSLGQGKLPGRPVLSANMAQAFTGRAPSVPTYLPPGVAAQPLYLVADAQALNADLDLKNLRPALAASGGNADMLPAGDDTATVRVRLPAAAITSYGYNAITVASGGVLGAPGQRGVIVASMATPTVDVQGIDVRALAATFAGMPGVPPALAAQLRGADLSRTLIVPVTDAQTVRNGTMIGGNPSTLIAQKDGSSAVALWFKGGILYVVAGSFDGETILKVAQSVK